MKRQDVVDYLLGLARLGFILGLAFALWAFGFCALYGAFRIAEKVVG